MKKMCWEYERKKTLAEGNFLQNLGIIEGDKILVQNAFENESFVKSFWLGKTLNVNNKSQT